MSDRIKEALRHLIERPAKDRIHVENFRVVLDVQYKIVDGYETEEDAEEFLRDLLEHDGEEISIQVSEFDTLEER